VLLAARFLHGLHLGDLFRLDARPDFAPPAFGVGDEGDDRDAFVRPGFPVDVDLVCRAQRKFDAVGYRPRAAGGNRLGPGAMIRGTAVPELLDERLLDERPRLRREAGERFRVQGRQGTPQSGGKATYNAHSRFLSVRLV
jgi:hypothetical protein